MVRENSYFPYCTYDLICSYKYLAQLKMVTSDTCFSTCISPHFTRPKEFISDLCLSESHIKNQ